jgi:hypothetical protein
VIDAISNILKRRSWLKKYASLNKPSQELFSDLIRLHRKRHFFDSNQVIGNTLLSLQDEGFLRFHESEDISTTQLESRIDDGIYDLFCEIGFKKLKEIISEN